jgi:hypothetical protein
MSISSSITNSLVGTALDLFLLSTGLAFFAGVDFAGVALAGVLALGAFLVLALTVGLAAGFATALAVLAVLVVVVDFAVVFAVVFAGATGLAAVLTGALLTVLAFKGAGDFCGVAALFTTGLVAGLVLGAAVFEATGALEAGLVLEAGTVAF